MRLTRFTPIAAGVMLVAGCDPKGGAILAPKEPLAATRFVNAMPDTGATDWRFIDQLENSPVQLGLGFRGFSAYQATAPGSRPLRIFPTSERIDVTSTMFADQALTFDANKYYTIAQIGFSKTGQTPAKELWVVEDAHPTVAAGKIALRVMHAGAGHGAVDIYAVPVSGVAPTATATPLFTNVGYKTATSYAIIDVLPNTRPATLSATAGGYARTEGSFLTDGFAVGMQITASGFTTGANNGRSVITAVTATSLSVTKTAPPVAEAAAPSRRIVGELVLVATAAGNRASVIAETIAPPGEEARVSDNLTAIGGSTTPLSVMTAMLLPQSVTGSSAASFATPAFVFMIDKHPR